MMKELQYPFDANYILSKKRKLKKQLLNEKKEFLDKNIAILGGSTTNDIKLILEIFLLNFGIRPHFYESEYNQYYQDAVFPNQELEEFHPDLIYVYTTNRNITKYPLISDTCDSINALIEQEVAKFESIWRNLRETYGCPIIQNNFEMPFYRLMGNKEASDIHGKVNFLARINMEFYHYAQEHENFYICDINYISADYGLREWADPFYYYMYKYALNVNAIPYLSFNVANIIKSIFGKNKKGFVLDLDNTLWGGIIGDDGVENIVLGQEDAVGQAYSEFQRYIKEHQQLGIILNIDSKNDYGNAVAGIKHPDSEFTEKDFISFKANWEPKDKNFTDIANELSLLPESLVFVDDNPAERYIITNQLPEVSAPEIGVVQNYIQNIDRNCFFEATNLSEDDLKRNEMYQENAKRIQFESTFADYKEYLVSLEMKGIIRAFEPVYMARIAQLTNKSNQFNLTTRRYTQSEIESISQKEDYITLYGKLFDKFGDNGVVSVIIGHKVEKECQIDLWIMSCRVLKRDMEFAMMDALVNCCKKEELTKIRGYYYPTAKNDMVRKFYQMQGFQKISEDTQGNTEWIFDIPKIYRNKNSVIKMED